MHADAQKNTMRHVASSDIDNPPSTVDLQGVPKERQDVFFSATMPRPIQELIRKYSHDPQNVRIEQKELTVPTVEQIYYEVDRRYKIELLTRLIDIHDLKLGIIFCNTKRMWMTWWTI